MIKKYHLCDLFTLLEVILACTLIVMTIGNVPPDYALWIFVAGELCDAVDGPCARRWHYPNDGKYRWWRAYHKETDQLSDIILAFACAFYIIIRISTFIGFVLSASVLFLAIMVQELTGHHDSGFTKRHPKLAAFLLRFRRIYYVFIGIGGAILTLLLNTSWPPHYKHFTIIFGVLVAILLIIVKFNRLRDIDTPL